MNSALLFTLMILAAIIMAVLPFGVLMGLGSAIGINGTDYRMIVGYILIGCATSYLTSFGSFALLQKSSCDEIKNIPQISANAGINLLFLVGAFALVGIIPWLRSVITDLLPPDIDPVVKLACVFAYYTAWATAFGFALGGTLSSSCAKAADTTEDATFAVPEETSAPASAPTGQLGAIPDE